MGSLLSRWKKKETTIEILEGIDKEILRIEKFRKSTQDLRSKVIGNLILYSIIVYIVACLALYFFLKPATLVEQCLQILPVLCFPFIIYLLKRILHWWFVRKISKNELEMQQLKEQRKEILENVMETETYKKAKEILEKFDPETKKKLEEEKRQLETPNRVPSVSSPDTDLRRRNTGPQTPQAKSPLPVFQSPPMRTPAPNISMGTVTTPMAQGPRMQGPRPPMTPILPRPILRQDRSSLEKLVEYFVGDGPENRYALICQNCFSHNGMALKEEFEYMGDSAKVLKRQLLDDPHTLSLSYQAEINIVKLHIQKHNTVTRVRVEPRSSDQDQYRCAYCGFFNPARKQRPSAPRLPARVESPMVRQNGMSRLGKNKDLVCHISSAITEENESDEDQRSDVMTSEAKTYDTKEESSNDCGTATTDLEEALAHEAEIKGLGDDTESEPTEILPENVTDM